jgi:hypothetical protein
MRKMSRSQFCSSTLKPAIGTLLNTSATPSKPTSSVRIDGHHDLPPGHDDCPIGRSLGLKFCIDPGHGGTMLQMTGI